MESDNIQWEISPDGHDQLGPDSEPGLTPVVLGLLPAGGVFLDVGAHVGHYTLRAARIASRVIAVEPNPDTMERLKLNLSINGITNVSCIQMAAWDGVIRLRMQKVHEQYRRDGSSRAVPDPRGEIWGARLDDMLSQYPLRPDRLDLVKVDVEGADLHALGGMAGLLARHRPVLVVEDHSMYGYYRQAELLELLSQLGYRAEQVVPEEGTWWLARPAPAPSAR